MEALSGGTAVTFTSALCCELLAQVRREWEGAAASVQALPKGTVPESSRFLHGWMQVLTTLHRQALSCPSSALVGSASTGMPHIWGQGCWTCRSSHTGKPGHSCSCKDNVGIQCPQSRSPSQQSGCLVVPAPWLYPALHCHSVAAALVCCPQGVLLGGLGISALWHCLRAEFRVRCEEGTCSVWERQSNGLQDLCLSTLPGGDVPAVTVACASLLLVLCCLQD